MSFLSTTKRWFGLDQPQLPQVTHVAPTFEERLNAAAAERGFAFDLLSTEVRPALEAAAEEEAAVAAEALEKAEAVRQRADEDAQRILDNARVRSGNLKVTAEAAQHNSDDDYRAFRALGDLLREDLHDVGPNSSEGWDA